MASGGHHAEDEAYTTVKSYGSLADGDIESVGKSPGEGTGTEFGTITNIVKNTVGAGILVLPMAFYKGGLVLGSLVLLMVCVSCAYSFYLLGKCCEKCKVYTLDELMQQTLGPAWVGVGSWIVLILCSLALVAYSVIIGVFLEGPIKTLAANFVFNKKPWAYTLIMTVAILLPLSCLKSLESLKFTSTAGVAIVFYGTALVVARCIYTHGKGKDFILGLYQAGDSTRTKLMETFSWGPSKSGSVILNIIGMLNTMSASSNCHFNAFSYYGDLKSRDLKTFRRITIYAFGIITVLNIIMSIAGYFAFGVLGKSGNIPTGGGDARSILPGLVPDAFLSQKNVGIVSKSAWEYAGIVLMLVWGLAISFSFPLIFSAMRNAMYEVFPSLAPSEDGSNETRKRLIATAIGVFSICAVATGLVLASPSKGPDIAYELFGLISCTAGNLITYILPGIMWIKLNPHLTCWQLKGPYFIAGLGIFFSIAGLVYEVKAWIDIFK